MRVLHACPVCDEEERYVVVSADDEWFGACGECGWSMRCYPIPGEEAA